MNTNCLNGVMCPECGHTEEFRISCNVVMKVADSGTEGVASDIEWDNESTICCPQCEKFGKVGEFQHPGFFVTYTTVTPESAELGDSHRHGWWDTGGHFLGSEPNDRPDQPPLMYDDEGAPADGPKSHEEMLVDWAVDTLKSEGARHPNCSDSVNADYWSTEGNEVLDFATGETVQFSYHFHGFTDEQRQAVATRLEAES